MIKSIRLVNFKNLADETLSVGPFTIIVGTNASGKSNIRDALRFLHGIGRGYRLPDIIGGKYGVGGQSEWAPIRGAGREIVRFGKSAFRLQVKMKTLDYLIEVEVDSGDEAHPGPVRVTREELRWDSKIYIGADSTIYTSHPGWGDPVDEQDDDTRLLLRMGRTGTQRKYGHRIAVRPDQPALTQIQEHRIVVKRHKALARQAIETFANMRFLDLAPNRMRQAALPGQTVLGDGGENLPVVLQNICTDPERKKILGNWLRELTPMDVSDFEFPRDPSGRVHLRICEAGGRKFSADSASDGTLRFLAMLAALLGEKPNGLYFFEEIDSGIHPARQWLLLDLIQRQVTKGKVQVMTTTHVPDLLTFVDDTTFRHMSVLCRLEGSEDAVIRPVAELPNARDLRKSQGGLGRLLTEGWMETAVAFTENQGARE